MEVQPFTGDADEVLDGFHLAQLVAGERASEQHFRIEPGKLVETHSHEHEQISWLSPGELVFTANGEEYHVAPDDSYAIPSEAPYATENRGDVDGVGIEVFVPPRPAQPWAGNGE